MTSAAERGRAAGSLSSGGPENLSRLDVVRCYERFLARPARVRHVPLRALDLARTLASAFHVGIAQVIECTLVSERTEQAFTGDGRPGIAPMALRTWLGAAEPA